MFPAHQTYNLNVASCVKTDYMFSNFSMVESFTWYTMFSIHFKNSTFDPHWKDNIIDCVAYCYQSF